MRCTIPVPWQPDGSASILHFHSKTKDNEEAMKNMLWAHNDKNDSNDCSDDYINLENNESVYVQFIPDNTYTSCNPKISAHQNSVLSEHYEPHLSFPIKTYIWKRKYKRTSLLVTPAPLIARDPFFRTQKWKLRQPTPAH